MTVYIEYAFIENFLIDLALLYLSRLLTKTFSRVRLVFFAALIGATFAVLYPLISLPPALSYLLKTAVGMLLCLIAFGKVKTVKEWGRYALNVLCFFFLTFAFAGLLLTVNTPTPLFVVFALALFAIFCVEFAKRLYKNGKIKRFFYTCMLFHGEKHIKTVGYYDSGNLAQKDGLPVCFVSPELVYELVSDDVFLQEAGQVRDELCITTLNGERKYRLFKGEIVIKDEKTEVYFAASAHMVSREYKILLPASIFGVWGKENGV
ncbi:MAG: sigma-E processing peptidase SpoIIGA [Clostridia bacterium]|nr:sigma-E processing peptidase SpoIIGA [Clostridia bacterium]